ncbi:MAG TPA: transketolase [Anaerolineae bacterium]|nr:transketolase [Anaerolineae bacterium]
MLDYSEMQALARRVRRHSVQMIHQAKASHLGSSLSAVELLVALYGGVLRVDPHWPLWPERDRFILSKGHACAAYYAVLAEVGFFSLDWLDTFYQNGSRLAGHVTKGIPGVEISAGSLGHGLSIATGMALAAKRDQAVYRVFCMLSDGECDEGSTWEPILFAPHHQLDNLVAIVDYNKIQALGHTREVLNLEPFAAKWQAFGWAVREVDGHNLAEIVTALSEIPYQEGKPSCVIAHTVKGQGISFMEDRLLWHYRSPQGDEYTAAMTELEAEP